MANTKSTCLFILCRSLALFDAESPGAKTFSPPDCSTTAQAQQIDGLKLTTFIKVR